MTSNRTQVHRPQVERPTEPKVVLEARDLVLIGMKRYDAGEMIEVSKEDYLAAMTKGIHPGTGRPISPLLNHFTLKSAPSDEIYDKAEAFYGEVEEARAAAAKRKLKGAKPEPIVPKVDMAPVVEAEQPKDEEPAPKRGRPAKQVEE